MRNESMFKKIGQLFLLIIFLFSEIAFASSPATLSSCLPASHFSHAGKGWPWVLLQADIKDWTITSNPGDSELTKMLDNTKVDRKITYDSDYNRLGILSLSCSYELSDTSEPLIIVTKSLNGFCLQKLDPSSLNCSTTLNFLDSCGWGNLLVLSYARYGFTNCNQITPG